MSCADGDSGVRGNIVQVLRSLFRAVRFFFRILWAEWSQCFVLLFTFMGSGILVVILSG